MLDPLFNLATPGFAFIFGISLGYFYYPKFKSQRARVRHMLNLGLCLVGASVLIYWVLGLAVHLVHGDRLTPNEIWGGLFGPLLYYFFALATAPIWFRILGSFRSEATACLESGRGASISPHRGCEAILLEREQTGFLQLCRLGVGRQVRLLPTWHRWGHWACAAATGIYSSAAATPLGLAGRLGGSAAMPLLLAGLTLLYADQRQLSLRPTG